MKKWHFFVALMLVITLLFSVCTGEQESRDSEEYDVEYLQMMVEKTEMVLANHQAKLERESVIYHLLAPYFESVKLSPEERDAAILELAGNLEKQAEKDKENGVRRDERTRTIPDDLLAFLTGDMTWNEFAELNEKQIDSQLQISISAEYGIEITTGDLRRRNADRDAELSELFAGFSAEAVTEIRLKVLDAYYSYSENNEKVRETEAKLEKYNAQLAKAYAREVQLLTVEDYYGVWSFQKGIYTDTGEILPPPEATSVLTLLSDGTLNLDLAEKGREYTYTGTWVFDLGEITMNLDDSSGVYSVKGSLRGKMLLVITDISELEYIREN